MGQRLHLHLIINKVFVINTPRFLLSVLIHTRCVNCQVAFKFSMTAQTGDFILAFVGCYFALKSTYGIFKDNRLQHSFYLLFLTIPCLFLVLLNILTLFFTGSNFWIALNLIFLEFGILIYATFSFVFKKFNYALIAGQVTLGLLNIAGFTLVIIFGYRESWYEMLYQLLVPILLDHTILSISMYKLTRFRGQKRIQNRLKSTALSFAALIILRGGVITLQVFHYFGHSDLITSFNVQMESATTLLVTIYASHVLRVLRTIAKVIPKELYQANQAKQRPLSYRSNVESSDVPRKKLTERERLREEEERESYRSRSQIISKFSTDTAKIVVEDKFKSPVTRDKKTISAISIESLVEQSGLKPALKQSFKADRPSSEQRQSSSNKDQSQSSDKSPRIIEVEQHPRRSFKDKKPEPEPEYMESSSDSGNRTPPPKQLQPKAQPPVTEQEYNDKKANKKEERIQSFDKYLRESTTTDDVPISPQASAHPKTLEPVKKQPTTQQKSESYKPLLDVSLPSLPSLTQINPSPASPRKPPPRNKMTSLAQLDLSEDMLNTVNYALELEFNQPIKSAEPQTRKTEKSTVAKQPQSAIDDYKLDPIRKSEKSLAKESQSAKPRVTFELEPKTSSKHNELPYMPELQNSLEMVRMDNKTRNTASTIESDMTSPTKKTILTNEAQQKRQTSGDAYKDNRSSTARKVRSVVSNGSELKSDQEINIPAPIQEEKKPAQEKQYINNFIDKKQQEKREIQQPVEKIKPVPAKIEIMGGKQKSVPSKIEIMPSPSDEFKELQLNKKAPKGAKVELVKSDGSKVLVMGSPTVTPAVKVNKNLPSLMIPQASTSAVFDKKKGLMKSESEDSLKDALSEFDVDRKVNDKEMARLSLFAESQPSSPSTYMGNQKKRQNERQQSTDRPQERKRSGERPLERKSSDDRPLERKRSDDRYLERGNSQEKRLEKGGSQEKRIDRANSLDDSDNVMTRTRSSSNSDKSARPAGLPSNGVLIMGRRANSDKDMSLSRKKSAEKQPNSPIDPKRLSGIKERQISDEEIYTLRRKKR